MSATILTVLGLGALFLLFKLAASRPADIGGEELDGATIILNESDLCIDDPVKLSGRPDQVWRMRDGRLVPVDTKKRRKPRAYDGDIVQLSAYAMLLRRQPRFRNARIAAYGFIRAEGEDRRARFIKVPLLNESEVIKRHARVTALQSGAVPSPSPSKALCSGCGHRRRCDAAL